MEVATHRHGCCVLQRCIDFANGQQRRRLVNEISSNALVLSQVSCGPGFHALHACVTSAGIGSLLPPLSSLLRRRHGVASCSAWLAEFTWRCVLVHRGPLSHTLVPLALLLSLQDPFGNYVVQYVLELGYADASIAVMNNLFGHYCDLAQQKFSSNVVEKCLKLGGSQLNEVRVVIHAHGWHLA